MVQDWVYLVLSSTLLSGVGVTPLNPRAFENGTFRGVLVSPGGELPFLFAMSNSGDSQRGCLLNGPERIGIPRVAIQGGDVVLDINQYDSIVVGTIGGSCFPDGRKPSYPLTGTWKRHGGDPASLTMDFHADFYAGYLFKPILKITEEVQHFDPVVGRWAVKFADEAEPAVGVFKAGKGRDVEGTFLTTTGDYRYLAGSYEYGRLRLSCFDGAHAFLFDAMMQPDGTLKGDFWSGPKYHDTWTAKRDDKAALPDGFALTKVNPKARLKDLKFRDLDGRERSPGDPALLGRATIIEVFGSWCPNCHDAAGLLVDLEKKYGPKGLKVLGLAFEMSGNAKRDGNQVRTYIARHAIQFPVLLAGTKDKAKASAALPVIDGLKAYPTFLFVDAGGDVRSVYTGFSGPATGDEHGKLRRSFESVIEGLLDKTP